MHVAGLASKLVPFSIRRIVHGSQHGVPLSFRPIALDQDGILGKDLEPGPRSHDIEFFVPESREGLSLQGGIDHHAALWSG